MGAAPASDADNKEAPNKAKATLRYVMPGNYSKPRATRLSTEIRGAFASILLSAPRVRDALPHLWRSCVAERPLGFGGSRPAHDERRRERSSSFVRRSEDAHLPAHAGLAATAAGVGRRARAAARDQVAATIARGPAVEPEVHAREGRAVILVAALTRHTAATARIGRRAGAAARDEVAAAVARGATADPLLLARERFATGVAAALTGNAATAARFRRRASTAARDDAAAAVARGAALDARRARLRRASGVRRRAALAGDAATAAGLSRRAR